MTLDEHRLEVVNKNFDVIKQCIDTTLDELYDFIDALKVENDTKNAEVLQTLADTQETLRKSLMNRSLNSFQLEQIASVLDMRCTILTNKAEQLIKAAEELNKLREEYADFKPEIKVVKQLTITE